MYLYNYDFIVHIATVDVCLLSSNKTSDPYDVIYAVEQTNDHI